MPFPEMRKSRVGAFLGTEIKWALLDHAKFEMPIGHPSHGIE